jgi:APA family basic amino acid/polyamine antiporter
MSGAATPRSRAGDAVLGGAGHPVAEAGSVAGQPRAQLSLPLAVALIVGIVIGAGIFKAPAMVAGMSGSATWMFVAWAAGGVISLVGALCYAELATTYPHAGGDYHFLHRAFGARLSFLYAWARFSVITTGSIALLAFVFGDYMSQLWPLGPQGASIYAAGSVIVLWWVNARGLRSGATAQGWLTAAEVGGLLLVVGAGAALALRAAGVDSAAAPAPASAAAPTLSSLGLAMVFVLLTFGGWNEAAYLSAELEDGRRNMVRALLWSIGLISALYLLVVWAYWQGLGLQGMADSQALAADLLQRAFGDTGRVLISLLVAVAALTSINATMIVGARTNFAVGRDWPALKGLGTWDSARGSPRAGLRAQNAMALLLVGVGALLGGGFKSMVEFTAPVFWLFFLAAGLSLFVLRWRDGARERPFKVPLYPLLPALFCAVCAYMLWSSLSYVTSQQLGGFNAAWIGVAVLGLGALLLPWLGRSHDAAARGAPN